MSTTAADTSNGGNRNAYLDFLRALAIISVVFVHSGVFLDDHLTGLGAHLPALARRFTDLGSCGVQLFFLISGWLLEKLYGKGNWQPKRYLARRFARIYPLWVLFLALSFVLPFLGITTGITDLLSGHSRNQWLTGSAVIVLATLTFTLWISPALWNNAVLGGWSIQAEVGHYLIFPAIRRLKSYQILLILGVARLITSWLEHLTPRLPPGTIRSLAEAWVRLGLANTLVFFVAGVLTCRWLERLWKPGVLDLLALAVLGISLFVWVKQPLNIPAAIAYIGTALALTRLALVGGRRHRWFEAISRYSYFTYFFHWFVIKSVLKILQGVGLDHLLAQSSWLAVLGVLALVPLTLLISTAVGSVSWRYFEKPIIDWSRRF